MECDCGYQATSTTTDSVQVLMIVDSDKNASTGVRAIRLERCTGRAWMFTGNNGDYAWKAFEQLPDSDTSGSFVIKSVIDGKRGMRTMLLNLANGKSWWHEAQKTGDVWCEIKLPAPNKTT